MKRPLSLVICLLVPIVVLVIGLFFAAVVGYREIPPLFEESGKGLANPKISVPLAKPGKYTVWLYTYTIFEGAAYESGDSLPSGARVHVFDVAKGEKLSLSSLVSGSKSYGSETAVSLGTFELLRPDREVEVLVEGLSDPVVISVAPTNTAKVVRVIMTLGGILIGTLFLAIVSLIVLLHRRQRQIQALENR